MASEKKLDSKQDTSRDRKATASLTVLHARPLSDLGSLQTDLMQADSRVADLFLRFVRETSMAIHDEVKLLSLIANYTFQTFPQASHFVLVTQEPGSDNMIPLLACSRSGDVPPIPLSTTLVKTVINEGVSLLYSETEDKLQSSESIQLSRISTAICAPLFNHKKTFGVIQLDIRKPSKGCFGRREVDLLAVFAIHVALVLDNLRLIREQAAALESTINALIHSLTLKDPDTARHSERVKSVAIYIGRKLGLRGSSLEALGMAALLHDLGKHGIRNEVLLKPARLSEKERVEMSMHSEHTQDILDKIRFPDHLKDVPLMAAYHHEKMDGSGPYKISGNDIPIQSRIVSVADAFDALLSKRVYKEAKPVEEVLAILEKGSGKIWDPSVVDEFRNEAPNILTMVYGVRQKRTRSFQSPQDQGRAA